MSWAWTVAYRSGSIHGSCAGAGEAADWLERVLASCTGRVETEIAGPALAPLRIVSQNGWLYLPDAVEPQRE